MRDACAGLAKQQHLGMVLKQCLLEVCRQVWARNKPWLLSLEMHVQEQHGASQQALMQPLALQQQPAPGLLLTPAPAVSLHTQSI